MSDEILKGNFGIQNKIKDEKISINKKENLKQELKERALASLGGSMVYVERDKLNWDGSETELDVTK